MAKTAPEILADEDKSQSLYETMPAPEDAGTYVNIWPAFRRWARDNGVSLEYEDDWKNWWDCFCSGNNATGE